MKQVKFLMVALTLLMGVSLTSCLNSGGSDNTLQLRVGKVYSTYGSYYFKTSDGYTITPTYASVASALADGLDLSKYVGTVIYFAIDIADATIDETAKTITDAVFSGCQTLTNTTEVVRGTAADKAANDSIGNTPIISLAPNAYESPSFMFDNYTLYLPTNYIIAKRENYVSLVYYTDEPEDNGDVLRVHLRYNSKGSTLSSSATSYEYFVYQQPYFYLKFFDMSKIFTAYMAQKGGAAAYPTKFQIVTHENAYSTNLEDSQTQEKVYTVEYKSATN